MILAEYQVYEKTVGLAIGQPRNVFGLSRMVECDCPNCDAGLHRMDAFNRGTSRLWYETREEADEAIRQAGLY